MILNSIKTLELPVFHFSQELCVIARIAFREGMLGWERTAVDSSALVTVLRTVGAMPTIMLCILFLLVRRSLLSRHL